jgi:hypothetical protein
MIPKSKGCSCLVQLTGIHYIGGAEEHVHWMSSTLPNEMQDFAIFNTRFSI